MILKLTTKSYAHILLCILTFPEPSSLCRMKAKFIKVTISTKLLSDTSAQCWAMRCYIVYSEEILTELVQLLEGKRNRRKRASAQKNWVLKRAVSGCIITVCSSGYLYDVTLWGKGHISDTQQQSSWLCRDGEQLKSKMLPLRFSLKRDTEANPYRKKKNKSNVGVWTLFPNLVTKNSCSPSVSMWPKYGGYVFSWGYYLLDRVVAEWETNITECEWQGQGDLADKSTCHQLEDLSLIPRKHTVGENWLQYVFLWPQHVCCDIRVCAHTLNKNVLFFVLFF